MHLSIVENTLRIELEWYEQLWAFNWHSTIEVPLDHIQSVTSAEPPSHWTEIRAPGTFFPGIIKAGTYYTRQGREFWYVTQDKDFLVLDLREEFFQRIVLTLEQSQLWIERLQNLPK